MPVKSIHRRLALWAIAWAMVLKAAVPLLASVAASQQGRSVAEVCEVYGVKLAQAAHTDHLVHMGHAGHGEQQEHVGATAAPGVDHAPLDQIVTASPDEGDPSAHGGSHGAAHSGDHCALTALVAFASQPIASQLPATAESHAGLVLPAPAPVRDAAADWVAGLKHGPPRST